MLGFDRKIRKRAKRFQVPDSYYRKVDGTLDKIKEDHVAAPRRQPFVKAALYLMVLCLMISGFIFLSDMKSAEAGFLEVFKQTIMDFFGMDEEESEKAGIESEKKAAVSKPDLLIELKEVVMDTQNIYAMVKITAPPGVEFKQGMTFDYFGFCEGTNYNGSDLVPGARECTLLEVLDGRQNVGMFVVSIGTDRQIEEGKDVTVFFEDLIAGPYEDQPEVLVEGIWSLSFTASYTNTKEVTVKGTDGMQYSFAGTKADIEEIKLLPLGLTLVSDVSRVDTDTLNTTDTRFVIRLKMIDGSETIVSSPYLEDDCLESGGSVGQYEENGRVYQKYVSQFREAVDISRVVGIYIADYYVPLKDYE